MTFEDTWNNALMGDKIDDLMVLFPYMNTMYMMDIACRQWADLPRKIKMKLCAPREG